MCTVYSITVFSHREGNQNWVRLPPMQLENQQEKITKRENGDDDDDNSGQGRWSQFPEEKLKEEIRRTRADTEIDEGRTEQKYISKDVLY